MSNKKILLLLSAVGVFFILSGFLSQYKEKPYPVAALVNQFQKDFLNKELQALELLQKIEQEIEAYGKDLLIREKWVKAMNDKYYSDGKIVVVSKADSIVFLSNNALPVYHNQLPNINSGLEHLMNGWYYVNTHKNDDLTIRVFLLVKNEYRYKNRFLLNEFYSAFNMPAEFNISLNSSEGYPVYTHEDYYAFSIVSDEDNSTFICNTTFYSAFLLAIIAIVLVIVVLWMVFYRLYLKGYVLAAIVGFFSSLAILRGISFYFMFPQVFYQSGLFSAAQYATSHWLPSLGDLLTNVLLINVFLFFCYRISNKTSVILKLPLKARWVIIISFSAILFAYAVLMANLLRGLVINSHLNLNVHFIFNLDIFSLLGFLIIAGLFFSYYFLGKIYLRIVLNSFSSSLFPVYFLLGFAIIALCILAVFFPKEAIYFSGGLIVTLFIFLLDRVNILKNFDLSGFIIMFFFYALLGTYALFVFNKEKEISKRINVALRMSSEHDPVAEYLFHELEDSIISDYQLMQIVMNNPYDDNSILDYLKNQYFYDFWSKYDIQITTCAPQEELIFKPFDVLMVCDDYFSDYIENFGEATLGNRFIYLNNNTGRNSYIVVIPIYNYPESEILYNLYLEFEAKFIPKELGFPELLIDEQIDISRNLGDYSYAIYKNQKMTNRFGSFLYSVSAGVYNSEKEDFVFFELDGYSHLLYNKDEETQIIVSKPRYTLLEKIAPFSYLFILFVALILMLWLTAVCIKKEYQFHFNFKKRLQFSMIAIVLISVVAIGSSSAWFIFNIYKNKNEAFINEKAHSILIELENHIAEEYNLDYVYSGYLQEQLIRLSNVFFTDINIFNPQGSLVASSRPRVFEEGLIAPLIDPVAFNQLKTGHKSLYVHNEKIGNLEYISAYIPLRNIHNTLIAYINLPYFAQQSELRNEISYFLVAFINIYLLLLLLTVILAFFISNYVTRPLQIIKKSLSSVSFGKNNTKIHWTRKDEIGQLISEYNRMIDELAVSAELLAQSERESAWREMAKQVAHEIKNPLTPMRLSVQYLQRAWMDNAPDWNERLDKFAKTMVEQIDTLSLIATEFSDFAKMPEQKNELIDLNEFIPEMLDLYKDFEMVSIDYKLCDLSKNSIVSADKKQLLRVFNNLIKNAIQAYDKNELARIEIICTKEEKYYCIEIKDFGKGIPEKLKKNIFQPYFTTKTSGMGLGLAMVRSIIRNINGHISFTSRKNVGTCFVIRIPRVDKLEELL